MVSWIIVLLVIIFILLMPIGIRITKNDERSDVDIFLSKIFNIRIDFDEFVRLLLTSRENRNQITLKSIINNLKIVYEFREVIQTVAAFGQVRYLTIIMKGKFEDVTFKTYYNISSELFFSFFDEYIKRTFKKVNNTYYSVKDEPTIIKNMFTLECIIDIRIIYFIIAFFKNYRLIPRMFRLLGRSEKLV